MASRDAVAEAISKSGSAKEVLENLGLRAAGGNHKALTKWCSVHGLELPVFKRVYSEDHAISLSTPDELVFIENSAYSSRAGIKKKLRKIWKEWTCADCGIGEEWNGKSLTLQLEHRNGIWNDNRLENLELLCPNCHSQTDSFAGRNKKK